MADDKVYGGGVVESEHPSPLGGVRAAPSPPLAVVPPAQEVVHIPPNVQIPGLLALNAPRLKAPLTHEERAMRAVAAVERKVRRKASRIVSHALAGAQLDDEGNHVETGLAPKEWSRVKRNVAMDARRPLKQRPYYLEVAVRQLDAHQRAELARERPVLAPINAEVCQVSVSQHVYQILELPESK